MIRRPVLAAGTATGHMGDVLADPSGCGPLSGPDAPDVTPLITKRFQATMLLQDWKEARKLAHHVTRVSRPRLSGVPGDHGVSPGPRDIL